jgi:integrase
MNVNYPKICVCKDKRVYVFFYINSKRYRLFNGRRVGIDIDPNSYPVNLRYDKAQLLAAEVYKYLSQGGIFKEYKKESLVFGKLTDREYLKISLNLKNKEYYTKSYKSELNYAYRLLISVSKRDKYERKDIVNVLEQYSNNSSYNSLLKNLKVLFNKAEELGLENNPTKGLKRKKSKANLNKPFNDIEAILEEIRAFNFNLYLCCIMTYGCLLRPHREVRELTWGDFTEDLSYIKLAGNRNKSGRNRIVPVPSYIKELLQKGESKHNIFTGTTKAPNPDYFKTIWGRFKKVSKLLEQDQTLYSFRHSGAINIFKRTGSLSKLQKAMGHSNMMVSMTYLRGLEVSELEESDMPMV